MPEYLNKINIGEDVHLGLNPDFVGKVVDFKLDKNDKRVLTFIQHPITGEQIIRKNETVKFPILVHVTFNHSEDGRSLSWTVFEMKDWVDGIFYLFNSFEKSEDVKNYFVENSETRRVLMAEDLKLWPDNYKKWISDTTAIGR